MEEGCTHDLACCGREIYDVTSLQVVTENAGFLPDEAQSAVMCCTSSMRGYLHPAKIVRLGRRTDSLAYCDRPNELLHFLVSSPLPETATG